MADIEITVEGGSSARLLTAGKYCDRNILVTATGGGGGGTSASPSDVNFYDYDGTLLYSYTIAEANLLTEMPQPPTHDGLTFQGWNYSIEEVQSTTRRMDVGATYITSDGKTRLYISVPANSEPGLPPPRNQVPLYFRQNVANGVTIDWGDGSPAETLSGTGVVNTTHTYETAGDFVISLNSADGCELELGTGSSSNCVMGATGNNGRVYSNMLKRVEVGSSVISVEDYAFNNCYSLSSVVIPDGVTSIGDSAFNNCYSLSSVVIPDGVTSIGSRAFNNCHSLSSVVIGRRHQHRKQCVQQLLFSLQCCNPGRRHQHRRQCVQQLLFSLQCCNPGRRHQHRNLCVQQLLFSLQCCNPGRRHQHRKQCVLQLLFSLQCCNPGQCHQHRKQCVQQLLFSLQCCNPGQCHQHRSQSVLQLLRRQRVPLQTVNPTDIIKHECIFWDPV